MNISINAKQFDTWLTEQQKTHEIYAPKCFAGGNTFSDADCIDCLRCLNGIMFGNLKDAISGAYELAGPLQADSIPADDNSCGSAKKRYLTFWHQSSKV